MQGRVRLNRGDVALHPLSPPTCLRIRQVQAKRPKWPKKDRPSPFLSNSSTRQLQTLLPFRPAQLKCSDAMCLANKPLARQPVREGGRHR